MEIISLVENTSCKEYLTAHGLSIYVKTKKHSLLVDLGPDKTIIENAKKANVDLTKIDTVIISHGHSDHGGALKDFLAINNVATIYIQESAFLSHFSIVDGDKGDIGLDKSLINHPQIKLINGNYEIDEELSLFIAKDNKLFHSKANDTLFENDNLDEFHHEQNLLIKENKNVLILGCGHNGVINILNSINNVDIDYCIGGFHLYHPRKKETVPEDILKGINDNLIKYNKTVFYTCHCTGEKAYQYFLNHGVNIRYLSCGDYLKI